MGRFEIILVLIGIVWTVVSAVAQKKAKAAKRASLEADDPASMILGEEDEEFIEEALGMEVDFTASARKTPFKDLRERRLAQLRSRSSLTSPAGVSSGTPIRVPPRSPVAVAPMVNAEPAEKLSSDQLPPIDEHGHEQPSRRLPSKKNAMVMNLREVLGDRQRVREAILLNEILDKPLSIRGISRS